jgi:hypothetical protein
MKIIYLSIFIGSLLANVTLANYTIYNNNLVNVVNQPILTETEHEIEYGNPDDKEIDLEFPLNYPVNFSLIDINTSNWLKAIKNLEAHPFIEIHSPPPEQ